MRRRQIYAAKTSEVINKKPEEKEEENAIQKIGKVVCANCNKLFDTRGYNVHRRNCK